MKLSHITLGVLILGASLSQAQDKGKKPKQDSTKVKCTNTKTVKNKPVKDSTAKVKHSARYCPACGMG